MAEQTLATKDRNLDREDVVEESGIVLQTNKVTKATKQVLLRQASGLDIKDVVTSSSVLESMPDEVLVKVIRYLEPDYCAGYPILWTKSTYYQLHTLVICSKRLYQLAVPYLYRTFVQLEKDMLPKFVVQLLEKPTLRKYVKHIISANLSDQEKFSPALLSDQNMARCKDIIGTCALGRSVHRLHAIKSGFWESLFAILLCITPRLESLLIYNFSRAKLFAYLEAVMNLGNELDSSGAVTEQTTGLDNVACSTSTFKYLKRVKLVPTIGWNFGEDAECLHTYDLSNILSLSNLVVLSLDHFQLLGPESRISPLNWELEIQYQNIRGLVLNSCRGVTKYLDSFLAHFPRLQSLVFETDEDQENLSSFSSVSFMSFITRLESTLHHLDLTCWWLEGMNCLGSFSAFHVLYTLSVQSKLLLNLEGGLYDMESQKDMLSTPLSGLLPPSLLMLKIRDAQPEFLFHIAALVKHHRTELAGLEILEVHFDLEEVECKSEAKSNSESESETKSDFAVGDGKEDDKTYLAEYLRYMKEVMETCREAGIRCYLNKRDADPDVDRAWECDVL